MAAIASNKAIPRRGWVVMAEALLLASFRPASRASQNSWLSKESLKKGRVAVDRAIESMAHDVEHLAVHEN